MLTATQLDTLTLELEKHAQRLEAETIETIAKSVAKTLTLDEDTTYLIDTMTQQGYDPAKVRTEVMKQLNASPAFKASSAKEKAAVKKSLAKSFAKYTADSDEIVAKAVAQATSYMTESEAALYKAAGIKAGSGMTAASQAKLLADVADGAKALVSTSAFKTSSGAITQLSKVYQAEVDYGLISLTSGLKTSDEVVSEAVSTLSKSGLKTVEFASGRSFQLDTAVRMAVQSAFSQAAGAASQRNMEELGAEYVEVSQSLAPRPSHAAWEGKVYSLKEFKKVCHYGETDNPDAIYAFNCHHNHYPYFPGISKPMAKVPQYQPKVINGKTYSGYELTQKQRQLERGIRALSREKNAREALGLETKDINARLAGQKAKYSKFSKAAGIKTMPNRIKVEA